MTSRWEGIPAQRQHAAIRPRQKYQSQTSVVVTVVVYTLLHTQTACGFQFHPCVRTSNWYWYNQPRRALDVSLFAKPPKFKTQSAVTFDASRDALVSNNATDETKITSKLRRTVVAKRPLLGHVVPSASRNTKRSTTTGGSSSPRQRLQGKTCVDTTSPSNLRIVAGTARGRRLESPVVHLRPMMAKVREAVFSTLTSFGLYNNKSRLRHLDIFAGSGSVGLESLSRGAAFCTFVDFSNECCQTIQRNLNLCQFAHDQDSLEYNRAQVICADFAQALLFPEQVGFQMNSEKSTFDLITLCPPYEEVVYAELLQAILSSPLVADDTVVVIEYPVELVCLPHVVVSSNPSPTGQNNCLVGVRNRRYGRTVIAIYINNPTGRLDKAESRPEEFVSI